MTVMLPPSDEFRLPGFLLGIIVAGIALFGDTAIVDIASGHGPPDAPLAITMCIAWATAGLGLLTVWLGIGRGWVNLRLLVVGVAGALLILILSEGRWSAEPFTDLVLLLAVAALPFGLLYLAGFELTHLEAVRSADDANVTLRRGQFSLRQLLGWTVAATLLASGARFAHIPPREWITSGVLAAGFSLIAVGAACATLMPCSREAVVLRLLVLGASAIVVTGGGAVLLATPGSSEDFGYLSLTALEHVSFMGFVLLLYRRLGYRLHRCNRAGMTAAMNAAPLS